MDYLEYFGLTAEPFSHAPVSRFYYASRQHTEALKRLLYATQTMKGLTILIGDIGHGKTTLARRLLDALPRAEFEAAMLVVVHAGITPNWLLKRIATQLGVPEPPDDKLAILSQLYARLLEIHQSGKRAIVLIDEAQMLATRELMEEFRGLLNLEVPDHKLISFVFFGLPDVERNLQLDPPLAQRFALRYHLKSLGIEETTAYVQHRLKLAGAKDELFPPAALAEVHRHTHGVPRVINTLCDNVLLELFFAKLAVATAEIVASGADNLQLSTREKLPAPTLAEAVPPPAAGRGDEDAVIAVPRTDATMDNSYMVDADAIAARIAGEDVDLDGLGGDHHATSAQSSGPADIDDPLGFLRPEPTSPPSFGERPGAVAPRAAAPPASLEVEPEPLAVATPVASPSTVAAAAPVIATAASVTPATTSYASVDPASIKPRLVVPAPTLSDTGTASIPGVWPPALPDPPRSSMAEREAPPVETPLPAAASPMLSERSNALAAVVMEALTPNFPDATASSEPMAVRLPEAQPDTLPEILIESPQTPPLVSQLEPEPMPAVELPPVPPWPEPPQPEPQPEPIRPGPTAIRTAGGTIDLSEIDDLLAEIKRR